METGAPNSGVHPDSGGGAIAGEGQLELISRRLETLERKLQDVSRADNRARSTARLVTIAIAVVAVGGVFYLLYPLINAYYNSEEYSTAMYAEFEETVQPAVGRELQHSLNTVGPEVVSLARAALVERQDELVAAADREMVALFESVKTMSEEELAARVALVEADVRRSFEKLFPELINDPEKMEVIMGNADLAMESAVAEVVNAQFSPHLEALANIETRLRQFPIPERIRKMSDLQLGDEFNRALAEYAIIIIRDIFLQGTETMSSPVVVTEAVVEGED